MNRWVDELPDEVRADVIARLRDDNSQHRAAWWELYLHAALRRAGYELVAHPEIAGSQRHPDYRVVSAQGCFYLEARITGHVPPGRCV